MKKSLILMLVALFAVSILAVGCQRESVEYTDTAATEMSTDTTFDTGFATDTATDTYLTGTDVTGTDTVMTETSTTETTTIP
jgi:hypothetical protein